MPVALLLPPGGAVFVCLSPSGVSLSEPCRDLVTLSIEADDFEAQQASPFPFSSSLSSDGSVRQQLMGFRDRGGSGDKASGGGKSPCL